MSLPANSTFLPILDDLLSPDLRPVLQTPTADTTSTPLGLSRMFQDKLENGTSSHKSSKMSHKSNNGTISHGKKVVDENLNEASAKIQNWWRKKKISSLEGRRHSTGQYIDIQAHRARHTISHRRTDEHVQYLESEISRLKSALTTEKKLRTLQSDAIRVLYGQFQKMSTESPMTQSLPNGLLPSSPQTGQRDGFDCSFPNGHKMSSSFSAVSSEAYQQHQCSAECSKEIQLLRESMRKEIGELRTMISKLTYTQEKENKPDESSNSTICETDNMSTSTQAQRPFSLNILSKEKTGDIEKETPEISGYATDMAKKLLETTKNATEKMEKNEGDGVVKK